MKQLVLVASSLLAFASCQTGLGNGPLDGRVYEVKLAGGNQAPQSDSLVFDGGHFESTACRTYGFHPTCYSGALDGDAATFEAAAKSKESGATAWSGKVHGDAVEGTLKWTNAKGEVTEFKFDGKSSSGALDGKTFEGMVCPGEAKTGDKDRLLFKHGAFDSNACRAYGFTMAPYTTTGDGDATHFSAVATNADGESNHWDGTIKGDDISGTMRHMNATGKVTDSYKFAAKLVK